MNASLQKESKVKRASGLTMPVIGLGAWQAADGEEVKQAIAWALQTGYRLIDTAKIYGNEEGVGSAITEASVSREDIFLTTKLWNTDQGYESALHAIDQSLARLKQEYVDLYLVHWPSEDKNTRQESWKAMEEIRAAGKAKAVGVSNYTIEHLEEMKNYTNIMPEVNQVEFHPFKYDARLLNSTGAWSSRSRSTRSAFRRTSTFSTSSLHSKTWMRLMHSMRTVRFCRKLFGI